MSATAHTQLSSSNTHRSSKRMLENLIDTECRDSYPNSNMEYRQQRVAELNSYRNYQPEEEHNESPDCEEQDEESVEMIIQLDSENSVCLKVHPNDNPLTLAQQFCYSQNIDPKVITLFAKQIKQVQNSNWPSIYPVSASISTEGRNWTQSQVSHLSSKNQNYLNSSLTQGNLDK